ncbi:MAG TPA: RluA family pseudouridine synthase [Blastocatellia bacterium]|nr:RluA family pseudouridine synthase [Blastocatellia bacterium]
MTRSFRFTIAADEARRRLDEFLASRFGALSRMKIASLIEKGWCRVNLEKKLHGYRLVEGDLVEIEIEPDSETAMLAEPLPLEIVHEDDCIVIVVKAAGVLVHPTMNVRRGTLANALAYHLNRDFYESSPAAAHGQEHTLARPGLVHRLDRATSGLMVVAKTQRALSVLSRHFHRRMVKKGYLAVVTGAVPESEGAIDAPLGRNPDLRPQWGVMEMGKPSETRYRRLERRGEPSGAEATLLELEPVTGRTNQLRIHCAHAGFPILGDDLYGGEPAARLCLHASRLSLNHPATGERLEFFSPLPGDIQTLFDSFL